MLLKNSKVIVIKIGSSLLVDNKQNIRIFLRGIFKNFKHINIYNNQNNYVRNYFIKVGNYQRKISFFRKRIIKL